MDASSFLKVGMSLFSEPAQPDRSYVTQNQHFKVICGVHPTVCMIVWGELKWSMLVEDACKPKHLLCVLIFLKTYTIESSLVVAIGVDEKTPQKWIFIIIYTISDMEEDWVGSLCSEDSSDMSNNCFSTDQTGEHVLWIPWQIMPDDGGWDRLLDM